MRGFVSSAIWSKIHLSPTNASHGAKKLKLSGRQASVSLFEAPTTFGVARTLADRLSRLADLMQRESSKDSAAILAAPL
jgi:hypothetical protein